MELTEKGRIQEIAAEVAFQITEAGGLEEGESLRDVASVLVDAIDLDAVVEELAAHQRPDGTFQRMEIVAGAGARSVAAANDEERRSW